MRPGGGSGYGPSPRDPPAKRQSAVRGGLRAHTRETVSLSPRGGGGLCRKWSHRSVLPPEPIPWGGYQQRVGRECVHVAGAGGQWGGDEEESHRHDA